MTLVMANWSEYPSDMLLWRGGHNVCVGIVIVLSGEKQSLVHSSFARETANNTRIT